MCLWVCSSKIRNEDFTNHWVGNKQGFDRVEEREGLSLGEHKPSLRMLCSRWPEVLTIGHPSEPFDFFGWRTLSGLQSPFSLGADGEGQGPWDPFSVSADGEGQGPWDPFSISADGEGQGPCDPFSLSADGEGQGPCDSWAYHALLLCSRRPPGSPATHWHRHSTGDYWCHGPEGCVPLPGGSWHSGKRLPPVHL